MRLRPEALDDLGLVPALTVLHHRPCEPMRTWPPACKAGSCRSEAESGESVIPEIPAVFFISQSE
jgi:hypothetical protein